MLFINDKRPEEISVNDQEVKAAKIVVDGKEEYIYGKKFPLHVIPPEHGKIEFSRVDSDYERAPLGKFDPSEGVFLADHFSFLFIPDEGYEFKRFTFELNGGLSYIWENPAQQLVFDEFTIGVEIQEEAMWRTVFEGTLESTHQTGTTVKMFDSEVPGIKYASNIKTRVTGRLMQEPETVVEEFTNVELPYTAMCKTREEIIMVVKDNYITFQMSRPSPTVLNKTPFFIITKIEQYY